MSIGEFRKNIENTVREWEVKSVIALQNGDERVRRFISRHRFIIHLGVGVIALMFLTDSAQAVTVESLRDPIRALKEELFGGWSTVVKIVSCFGGLVWAGVQRSVLPLGGGCAVAIAIHFYDLFLGDGSGAQI